MNNDALQLVVTILGILSQLILLVKETKGAPEKGAHDSPANRTPDGVKPPVGGAQRKSVLDLSFVLLCSTFFSLILMDSLVISGRAPSPGPGTIMAVFTITAVVFAIMFGAWYLGKSEMVTGFIAITTLAVLIMSPGGPFGDPEVGAKENQVGLSLYLPVLSLVTLASAMMIYWYGSPVSNQVARRKRYAVGLTLAALFIVGAGALGRHVVTQVMRNKNTPKIESEQAKALLRQISHWNIEQRQKFYQAAAEITLAKKYQENQQLVRSEQQQLGTTREARPTTTPSPASSPAPAAATPAAQKPAVAASATAASKDKGAAAPSTQASPVEADDTLAEDEAEPSSKAGAADDGWLRSAQTTTYGGNKKTDEEILFTRGGSERITKLIDTFSDMKVDSQVQYLLQRLDWIHPVGLGPSQANVPLTGTKIEDRFENIGFLRLVQTLKEQPNVKDKLSREFNYPEDVKKLFSPKEQEPWAFSQSQDYEKSKFKKVIQNLLPQKDDDAAYRLTLFPRFDASYSPYLRTQLTLPNFAESAVAYGEYAHLALQLVKEKREKDASSQTPSKYEAIAKDYENLSAASQSALRYYVANDKSPSDVFQNLGTLFDVNFKPLATGSASAPDALRAKIETYLGQLPPTPPPDGSLERLAYDIVNKRNADATATIIRLLNKESNIPLQPLFKERVFEFIKKTNDNLVADEKQDFLKAVADPVWPVVQAMAHDMAPKVTPTHDAKFFDQPLETFRGEQLTDDERDNLLHQMAISLYRPGGEYSLDAVSLLIVQARAWSETAALIFASIIMLPLMTVCIFFSGYFARKLVARDRMRELVSKELESYSESSNTVGTPVELQGRGEALNHLRSLAERGWSTIGVVGRRGVGKSRILYALSQPSPKPEGAEAVDEGPTVKVWVASPSRFQEDDFITSIFERLAISTEGAIASFLGAQPLSIRRIESRATRVSLWYYAVATSLLLAVMYQMYDRLTNADIVVTWLPIAALLFGSFILLAHYISKMQPVDLSSWLQRDRSHNPHTVMLYREVSEALKYLRRRARQSGDEELIRQQSNPMRNLLMRVMLGVFFITSFYVVYGVAAWEDSSSMWDLIAGILVAGAAASGWMLLYRQRESTDSASTHGQSVMSLIAEYRSFAATIVYRLKQEALGHSENRRFSVLICVDELDKIVDSEEIRAFVRRIKAIFEVPGVYYYVSLAEDTLTALYLGASAGKNEIDSSFDHIVRIMPLSCDVGEAIATNYLQMHKRQELPPRLARTVATLSYGIPRDIIRRCDEYLARADAVSFKLAGLVSEIRRTHAALGYELHELSNAQVNDLSGDPTSTALIAQSMLGNELAPELEQHQRFVLSLWLLALIEMALALPDEQTWREVSSRLCAFGYKLPAEQVSDLRPELEKLHTSILAYNLQETDMAQLSSSPR